MKLTAHFHENWSKRVEGPVPEPDRIEEMIAESVIVQRFKAFTLRNGFYYKRLAIYWNPELGIVLKIDEGLGNAVSVMSAKCLEEKKK